MRRFSPFLRRGGIILASLLMAMSALYGLVRAADREPASAGEAPMMRTATQTGEDGPVRTFAGRAAPPPSLRDPRTGREIRIYDFFPNDHDPFPIATDRELGEGGYALKTPDRGLAGVIPSATDAPWALNMIPFGVALDGSFFDPSGPWYDGGRPDPRNPFDRNCTGWEYEVLHPSVRQMVGLPDVLPGHVQPGGVFHYHGRPDALIAFLRERQQKSDEAAGPLPAGYSADGFPIVDYVVAGKGTAEKPALYLFSGYVLRTGNREAVEHTNPDYIPAGAYDGLYVQDYVFDMKAKAAQIEEALAKTGEYYGLKAEDVRRGRAVYALLDRMNGHIFQRRDGALPGYPDPHYAYVLTPDWPQVPRLFALEPAESFRRIIPFEFGGLRPKHMPAGAGVPEQLERKMLYGNCASRLQHVHQWQGRAPY